MILGSLRKNVLTGFAAAAGSVLLAASVSAFADDLPEAVWSASGVIDTATVGAVTNAITITNKFAFGTSWAPGFSRSATITATSRLTIPYVVYTTKRDNVIGKVIWDYLEEDELELPRYLVYKLTHEIRDGNQEVIETDVTYVTIGEGSPISPTWSGDGDVDTLEIASGNTIELKSGESLTYGANWASGYERKISLFATCLLPGSETYEIMTSGVEEYGNYAWNYSEVAPSILPRNTDYTLSYVIFNDDMTIDSQDAIVNVTLVPEPALLFSLLLLLPLMRKL